MVSHFLFGNTRLEVQERSQDSHVVTIIKKFLEVDVDGTNLLFSLLEEQGNVFIVMP